MRRISTVVIMLALLVLPLRAATPPLGLVNASRLVSSSSADRHRRSGSFSRQRMIAAANAGGTSGRTRAMGCGVWVTCAASMR